MIKKNYSDIFLNSAFSYSSPFNGLIAERFDNGCLSIEIFKQSLGQRHTKTLFQSTLKNCENSKNLTCLPEAVGYDIKIKKGEFFVRILTALLKFFAQKR